MGDLAGVLIGFFLIMIVLIVCALVGLVAFDCNRDADIDKLLERKDDK